jgi:hypothetical protein
VVLPPVTASVSRTATTRRRYRPLARVPFRWRAELSTDGQVCIFTDRCMLGRMDALNTARNRRNPATGVCQVPGKQPGAAAGAAAA